MIRFNKYLFYLVLYRLLLDYIFFNSIIVRHGYEGFVDKSSISMLFVSWIILLLFYNLIKDVTTRNDNNSNYILQILFLVSFVPFTSCIYSGVVNVGFIIYNIVYWMVLLVGTYLYTKVPLRPYVCHKSRNIIFPLGVFFGCVVILVSYIYTGFRLDFNLYEVYELRMEARMYNFPLYVRYLFSWSKFIIPMVLAVCLLHRKYFLVILFFCIQMLSFGIDGTKTTFIMPFLVFVMLLKREINNNLSYMLLSGVLLITICCGIEIMLDKSAYIADFFIRRIMYVPNLLGDCYYDFFTLNQSDYFRSSFLRYFDYMSPYTANGGEGYTYIIGDVYFGKPNMSCNNGLSSDAIANFGMVGCFLSPIFLLMFFRMFDKSTMNVDKTLVIIPVIHLSYTLLSTTLTTVLFTHGGAVIVLLMMFMSDRNKMKYN